MFRCYSRLQTPALDTHLRGRYSIFDKWHPGESTESKRDVLQNSNSNRIILIINKLLTFIAVSFRKNCADLQKRICSLQPNMKWQSHKTARKEQMGKFLHVGTLAFLAISGNCKMQSYMGYKILTSTTFLIHCLKT